MGSSGPRLSGDQLEQSEVSAGPNVVRWQDSDLLFDSTSTTYTVDTMRSAALSEVGLVFGINGGNYWSFTYTDSKVLLTGWTPTTYTRYRLDSAKVFPTNVFTTTKVKVTDQNVVTFWMGATQYGPYKLTGGSFVGAVGLITLTSTGKFQDPQIQTSTRIVLALTTCDTPDNVKDKLSNALNVPPSQFSDVQGTSPCGGKRQGSFSAFAITVEGTPQVSSQAVASQLSSLQSANHISLSANGVGVSSVSTAPLGADGVAIETLPIEAVVAITAAGLSVAVIAVIVVAAVVVGAGATAGTVVAVKKLRAPKPAPVVEEEPMTTRKPKGVDLYKFDPESITSITARSPPQQKEF
jgi:hypothetical protein